MKSTYLLGLLLLFLCLVTCQKEDPPQAVSKDLTGKWVGMYKTQQIGACNVPFGNDSLTAEATWEVVNDSVKGVVNRNRNKDGIWLTTHYLVGRFDGDSLRVGETITMSCGPYYTTYVLRFKGVISGNTLNLVSHDTLCPLIMKDCFYLRTLKLMR